MTVCGSIRVQYGGRAYLVGRRKKKESQECKTSVRIRQQRVKVNSLFLEK